MASLSIPPPAGPTSSRLDWGHTGERKSTPRGPNRGRGNASASRSDRGGGRGGRGRRGGASTRGGRSHGSSPTTERSISTPTANLDPKSAPSIVSAPSQTSNASKKSSSSSPSQPLLGAGSSESKDGPQRAPGHAADNKLPSLTIEPASPTTAAAPGPHSASTTSSRMSTRRRRSHNKPSGTTKPSEGSTAEAHASTVKARKSRSGPSSPHPKNTHPKNTPPKNPPPHLSATSPTVASSSAKTNIDSLVEHVRALAMDHRPSTPGSHIDWADEDDSLPDLDDWGVPSSSVAPTKPEPGETANIEKAQLQLMSPILDDSLKQLPHSFDKTSPSPSVVSGSLSPNITNGVPVLLVSGSDPASGAGVAKASSNVVVDNLEDCSGSPRLPEPPSGIGPASPPSNSQPLDSSHPPERATAVPSKDTPPHIPVSTPDLPAPTSPPIQPGRSLADSIHAPHRDANAPAPTLPPETSGTESAVGASTKGFSASADAPESEASHSEGVQRSAPPPRNPTHGRSHTVGRPSPFSAGAKRGFFSGSSTPSGRGPHPGHGRTQSSPVAHRRQHSRPVITMDAMTRLAKSLGTGLPKREVAATNSATSSE